MRAEQMSEIEARLKTDHAAVFLTLVSVVVALALEDLLSQVRESPVLWQADGAAVVSGSRSSSP
jgi:hypothetical protein